MKGNLRQNQVEIVDNSMIGTVVISSVCMLQRPHMFQDFETPLTPSPCCYMLNATMPSSLVIVVITSCSNSCPTVCTPVRSCTIPLFLSGEVGLVLRCISRGIAATAVASSCQFISSVIITKDCTSEDFEVADAGRRVRTSLPLAATAL